MRGKHSCSGRLQLFKMEFGLNSMLHMASLMIRANVDKGLILLLSERGHLSGELFYPSVSSWDNTL